MPTIPAERTPLLNREEAAEYLGVQPQTLSIWSCTGRYDLPYIRVGRLVKYRLSDLEEFLEKRTVRATPPVMV